MELNDTEVMFVSEDSSKLRSVIAVSYCIVFAVGTLGNIITIVTISNVLLSIRRQDNPGSSKHVFLYVLGLSIADLLLLSHIPFLVVHVFYQRWVFGTVICNIYWITESVNKLLSTLILTLLSWDRWIAVTRPFTAIKFRSLPVASSFMIVLIVMSILFQMPVLTHVSINHGSLNDHERAVTNASVEVFYDDYYMNSSDIMEVVPQCTSRLAYARWWILLLFVCGYCIPAILMSCFYISLVRTLKRTEDHETRGTIHTHHTQPRIKQVTLRVVSVIIFYFMCWTPYWTLQLLLAYRLIYITFNAYYIQALIHASHLLVAVNSALNPIFYALLNRELRQQHDTAMRRRRHTLHNALDGAFNTMEKHGTWLANKFKQCRNDTVPNPPSTEVESLLSENHPNEGHQTSNGVHLVVELNQIQPMNENDDNEVYFV